VTPNSDHTNPVAPNLLGKQFSPATIGGTTRVWASDITYISTREGWLHLSVVIDLGSRRVVGWAMQETLERSLVIDALRIALRQRQPTQGMIHHSDRGIQYASTDYGELLKANRIECSMSRLGDCWDNAVAESFFATLKKELVGDSKWETRAEARAALFEFIEVWYNRQRRHSSIEYLSPAEYEKELLRQAA
jgi:putative transposase